MLWWLAETALVTVLLTGLVIFMCRLGRFGPAVRHALWLVVLIKLLTPPVLHWPWALPGIREAPPSGHGVAEDPASPTIQFLLSRVEMVLIANDLSPGEDALLLPGATDRDERLTTNQAESASGPHIAWIAPLLQHLWLVGTAVVCFLQVVRIFRFRRLLARVDPAPRWLEKLVAEVAGTLRIRRPRTLLVAGIGSPFVWSLGRPKLLWPASLLECLPHHCQRSIVAHELAHLRRRDHWVGWLQLIAECLWWWNPIFWYVRRHLRLNAELACDAWVVSTLPEDRRAYAEALIEVTQLIARTAAPMPALGISSAARQDFERRLTMIMRDRVPCRVPLVGVLAIGVLALITLPGWTQVQVQKLPEGKEKPEPETRIILDVRSDVEIPEALKVLQWVEGTEGEKRVRVVAAQPDTASDRELRLQKLEQQLQELLKEVQALRAGGSKGQTIIETRPLTKPAEPIDRPRSRLIERKSIELKPDSVPKAPEDKQPGLKIVPQPQVENLWRVLPRDSKRADRKVALIRVTYKLSHAKAEALASLLTQHSKAEVLEARVEGDNLTVTTTPEAEKAITQFISLIQGSTATEHRDTKTGRVLELKPAEIDNEPTGASKQP
jgi:beta-lactamase regulating signal transducer with metallopeptidase domain